MENPFRRRATEFLREDEAFLAVVTPEPVEYYLSKNGRPKRLYDRLVLLRGTPGSGKTTLAKLFEYPTFHALAQNQSLDGHKSISAALAACGALKDSLPQVLGFRIPLETDYRGFWEFDYSDKLKTNLMTAFLQARAVLGWFRHLKTTGIQSQDVSIVARADAEEITDTIGGINGAAVREKAAQVENAIYQVMNSLIAPPETELANEAIQPYRPFDIIERIRIPNKGEGGGMLEILPLAIFDDAQFLHPDQFRTLQAFLLRRELRVARWMIARLDVLLPHEALEAVSKDAINAADFPGVSADREAEVILLQSTGKRRNERTRFRKMSGDMAARYLRRMPVLSERGLTNLGNLLGDSRVEINKSSLVSLRKSVAQTQKRFEIRSVDREVLEAQILDFQNANSEDIRLQMLEIMMHRFAIRRGRKAPMLFDYEDEDLELDIPVAANDGVYSAALFRLHHHYSRPYFFGLNDLCDASSENAEQFLQLSAELVEEVVTQVARGKDSLLTPAKQDALLRKKGKEIIEGWNFPHVVKVKRLVTQFARLCFDKSNEPNGSVIANAIGIPMEEFDSVAKTHPSLASVLQFAIAYNAISLVPNYPCKNKSWCLLEVGGMVALSHGLTLRRGGFVESSVNDVSLVIEERPE